MKTFQPVIKWSGSKRSQSNEIISYFPRQINTYYEPFCGGCSVLMSLLNSDISVDNYICSDINQDLINLWNLIKANPQSIYETYENLWTELNRDDDIDRKRKFFEQQRSLYNQTHSPLIFFFIMRTTTNGMPRYNSKGEFNNSFHITRNGITPKKVYPILIYWHEKLNEFNVTFKHSSFEDILSMTTENDFVYMDPPYFNTKGMYYGNFNHPLLFDSLQNLTQRNVKFALSFNGITGDIDNTYNLPQNCYKTHHYLKSGNSSFKRTIGKDNNAMVFESLYLNY